MRLLIVKTLLFCGFLFAISFFATVLVPNRRAASSLLETWIAKKSALSETKESRIILSGGSSTLFSYNSQRLSDSLGIPVINMGYHAGAGLKFMLSDILPELREGDILVVIPEYAFFYNKFSEGDKVLLSLVLDIYRQGLSRLSARQWIRLSRYLPRYGLQKTTAELVSQIRGKPARLVSKDAYGNRSINEVGDHIMHWNLPNRPFFPDQPSTGKFDNSLVPWLEKYAQKVKDSGAHMVLLFPAYQKTSGINCQNNLKEISAAIKKSSLNAIGSTSESLMHDSLFFDTSYHLNKNGVDIRTNYTLGKLREFFPAR